jgi:hypothetical protein
MINTVFACPAKLWPHFLVGRRVPMEGIGVFHTKYKESREPIRYTELTQYNCHRCNYAEGTLIGG